VPRPVLENSFHCGPLEILVGAESEALSAKIAETLELYNVAWDGPYQRIRIDLRESDEAAELGPGDYLTCQRTHVDRNGPDLVVTSRAGAAGTFATATCEWKLVVPRRPGDIWVLTDIEHLLSLVLTVGWRSAGWVPVHAGAVVSGDRCAIVCAESGGGKTSLTAALIRAGWRTLGDDKLLLRLTEQGTAELRALVHTFNLDPRTRDWFPEVGDLERLPRYSEWTHKRKVCPTDIWPGTTIASARPSHVIQLLRDGRTTGMAMAPLDRREVLSVLLRQIVIPADRDAAEPLLRTAVTTAGTLAGVRLSVGENAYADSAWIDALRTALQ